MSQLEDIKESVEMQKRRYINDSIPMIVLKEKDVDSLIALAEKAKQYEDIISAIANIDTFFISPTGDSCDYTDKQALEEIYELVTPIWNEVATRHNEEFNESLKDFKKA